MLSSKANAALARLKEIEEKYKIKRDEWNRQKVSIFLENKKKGELERSLLDRNFVKL